MSEYKKPKRPRRPWLHHLISPPPKRPENSTNTRAFHGPFFHSHQNPIIILYSALFQPDDVLPYRKRYKPIFIVANLFWLSLFFWLFFIKSISCLVVARSLVCTMLVVLEGCLYSISLFHSYVPLSGFIKVTCCRRL